MTIGTWSARYFTDAADAEGVDLGAITGAGTAADPFVVADGNLSLAADGSDRIVLVADVSIPASVTATGDQLSNIASVESATFERDSNKPRDGDNPNPNEDAANKTLSQAADLLIEKSVNTAVANAGSAITWQLTPRNLGPSDSRSTSAERITITDTVPEGVRAVTASSNSDWDATLDNGEPIPAAGVGAGTVIRWTYKQAAFAPGAAASVTLTGTIDADWTDESGPAGDGSIVNVAVIHPGETHDPDYTADPDEPGYGTQNNRDTTTTQPGDDTSLAIVKTRVVLGDGVWRDATDSDEFAPGEPLSYRISVTNNGPAVARNVQVVDEVPEGLTYRSHANDAGSWAHTAGGTNAAGDTNAGWDTFALSGPQAVGATTRFVVTYDTAPSLDPEEGVDNTAEASADNSTNDPHDSDDTRASRRADLSIVKTHTVPAGDAPAVAGESVTYRLVVTNEGPSDATAAVDVVDTLPAGFSYRTDSAVVTVEGGAAASVAPSVDGQQLTWTDLTNGRDLPDGATIVITFVADIASDVPAQADVVNITVVDSPDDVEPSNNEWKDPIDIVANATMTVVKKVEDTVDVWTDAATKVAGTNVTYRLTVENTGPSAVPASITDTLPAGMTLVSMGGVNWDCSDAVADAQDGTCEYVAADQSGLHPVGTSAITVVAHLASGVTADEELENQVVLTWTDSKGSHADDDTARVTVTNVADLGVKKSVRTAAESDEWTDAQDAQTAGAVIAGSQTEYRLVVTNEGPSDAVAPIVVVDALPEGATFGELVDTVGWSAVHDDTANTVTFTRDGDLGRFASGAQPLEIVYSVSFDSALEVGTVLENVATVADETLDANNDGNPRNNSDPAHVIVDRVVDLSIVKTHTADTCANRQRAGL